MEKLFISADDLPALGQALGAEGVACHETKSDIPTLLVALGGGAGLATLVGAVGRALQSYFKGRQGVESARSVKITTAHGTVEINGGNVGEVLDKLPRLLSTMGKR